MVGEKLEDWRGVEKGKKIVNDTSSGLLYTTMFTFTQQLSLFMLLLATYSIVQTFQPVG